LECVAYIEGNKRFILNDENDASGERTFHG
jgi:hypothetical protein